MEQEDIRAVARLQQIAGWRIPSSVLDYWATDNRESRGFVATVEGDVVGCVALDTVFPPYAEIVNLVVDPNYRRQGIGTMLLRTVIYEAECLHHTLITLLTERRNYAALRLYARHCFLPSIANPLHPQLWLFRYGANTPPHRFLQQNPFAQYRRLRCGNRYGAVWYTPKARLRLCFGGQPGQPSDGVAPHIRYTRILTPDTSVCATIRGDGRCIQSGESASFIVELYNSGGSPQDVTGVTALTHPDTTLVTTTAPFTLQPHTRYRVNAILSVHSYFAPPPTSFPDVLATLIFRIGGQLLLATAHFRYA